MHANHRCFKTATLTSSIPSPASFLTSPSTYLIVFLFFSFLFSSTSSFTSTTFQAERGHPSSTCYPPSLRLASPQVDVRESSTQAPGRTTTEHPCERKKMKNTYAVSLESEPREGATRRRHRPHLFIHIDHVYSVTNAAGA